MNNNAILFECASKPPQEVDSIGFASDAHRMRIKSMLIHVNTTDPDRMRIKVPMWKRLYLHDIHTQLAKAHPKMSYIRLGIWITCHCLFARQVSPQCQMHNMWPNFGKPGLSCKMLFQVICRFRLVTVILSILIIMKSNLWAFIWYIYEVCTSCTFKVINNS